MAYLDSDMHHVELLFFLLANVAAQSLQAQAQDWTSDLRTLQPHVSKVEITPPARLDPISAVGAGKYMHIPVHIYISLAQHLWYIVCRMSLFSAIS